jgi:hypothetical protein
MDHVVHVERRCYLLDICYQLSSIYGEKALRAVLCSAGYGASTMAREVHRQLSISGILTHVTVCSVKPARGFHGDGSSV